MYTELKTGRGVLFSSDGKETFGAADYRMNATLGDKTFDWKGEITTLFPMRGGDYILEIENGHRGTVTVSETCTRSNDSSGVATFTYQFSGCSPVY